MNKCISIIIICFLSIGPLAAGQQEPSNSFAEVQIVADDISVKYDGREIFSAKMASVGEIKHISNSYESDGKISQVIMIQGSDITVSGIIYGSDQAFPCQADRSDTEYEPVRHCVGLSHSLLNRAVYDRKYDWVLSVDEQGSETKIVPDGHNKFRVEIHGNEICLRFRPRYYQMHRGLTYFEPWKYSVDHIPVVGWCSWFAFFDAVTEDDIRMTADILSEKLVPYGLKYLQIDDGYQQEPGGMPSSWLNPNEKFPRGLENLAGYIENHNLIPGIWTYMNFHDSAAANDNKEFFVPDENGDLATGRWIEYILDGSGEESIDRIIRPTYSGLKDMGWKYFKVDGLRHLRYDGYNSYPDYFRSENMSVTEAFRNVVLAVREETGPDNLILACWGIRPELTGIVDACRIGTDGYGLGGLSQYNSFNNIVWQNDPDHIEASGELAYRDCMATSLTGSLYMITDKPGFYSTGNLEPVIRTIPVLHTLPGQLYDVDPSRSMYLDRVDFETSGSGERVFDAGRTSFNDLFLLEINRPYENWIVLGRTGDRINYLNFDLLGLEPDEKYYVFEFWTKKLLGEYHGGFLPGNIDPEYKCQSFCIRKKEEHPQLIATNRHISCGAPELKDMVWENNTLSGRSDLVPEDDYIIYIVEPEDYTLKEFKCDDNIAFSVHLNNGLREIHMKSAVAAEANWEIHY